MQSSKLATNMLKYLPVLAVLIATGLGLFIGQGLYPASIDSHTTPAQILNEPNHPEPLIVLGAREPCGPSAIYTSLPPKCKNLDGEFIPVPGTSPYHLVTPEGK